MTTIIRDTKGKFSGDQFTILKAIANQAHRGLLVMTIDKAIVQ